MADDSKLIRRMRRGSTAALEQLITRYTAYVSAAAYRVLGPSVPREDLEEVVADVFVALWRSAAELDPERDSLRPWLGTVAANKAKNVLRSLSPTLPLSEDVAAPDDPASQTERRDAARTLWEAVDGLDEPDRTLFLRYYYEGDKLRDVAAALGMNLSTAKTRLFRGRKVLAARLGGEMGGMAHE